jgi:hypothetical protein
VKNVEYTLLTRSGEQIRLRWDGEIGNRNVQMMACAQGATTWCVIVDVGELLEGVRWIEDMASAPMHTRDGTLTTILSRAAKVP